MSTLTESLGGKRVIAPHAVIGATLKEDLALWRRGIVSTYSLRTGYRKQQNAIVLEVRGADGHLKQRIYDHNVRTNTGGTYLMNQLGGDVNANNGYENHAGACAYTATTVTPTASPVWTVNQYAGHIVVAGLTNGAAPTFTWGVILSNTATALTIDQWYNAALATGVAGSTPAVNCSFVILPGQAPAFWIGLTTDTTTEAATDTTLTTEQTTGFTVAGRYKGTFVITQTPSGAGTSNNAGIFTLATATLSSNGTNTFAKAGIFDAQNGGIMVFEKKFGTSAALISGDTLTVTWTITAS